MAVENTTCVQPQDYEEPGFTAEIVVIVGSVVAAIFTGGAALIALGPTAFSVLRKVLEYMLNGKLVCLGGDRCAIGYIAELEPVGYQKSFPDDIDDDYSFNVVLEDASLHSFVRDCSDPDPKKDAALKNQAKKENLKLAAENEPQGELVAEQPGMPKPREPAGGFGHYSGYYTWFEGPDYGKRFIVGDKQVHVPFPNKSPGGPFPVPVLHAECEGNRISNLLDVLDNIPPGLGKLCKVPIIGWLACAIVSAIFLPVVALALAVAWFASEHGDPADVGAGTVEVGELVVLNGRWCYDAAHGGYNELHPLKTLQKVPDSTVPSGSAFEEWRNRWCGLTTEPPPRPAVPGTKPQHMTPPQEAIWESQQRPENDWELHPEIDGCLPTKPGPPPEPERPPIH